MKVKKNLMWSLSLIVIGVSTLIISGSNILGTQLPDMLTRTLGIAELIALPFLAYSTIKNSKQKNKTDRTRGVII